MILKRLYELAEREQLLDDPAFESQPVPIIVKLARDGEYLGVEERRGVIEIPSRKKDTPPRTKPDKGKMLSVPKAHGNTANRGFSRFFVDTLSRILPVTDDAKSLASRVTFWQQIDQAAEATQDPALLAVQIFGKQFADDPALAARVKEEVEALRPGPGDRCTFAWHPDEGATVIERETVRQWYRRFFGDISEKREAGSAMGICQITGEYGPLPMSHATKIRGIRGGLPQGVSLVSFDKSAFESYGLDKAVNAGIGYRAAEGYTRSLNALAANELPGRPHTCLHLGDVTFLFWTRELAGLDDVMSFGDPKPDQVAALIESMKRGRPALGVQPNDFYCLSISGNAARAVVRDYLEAPLPVIQANLGLWFRDLEIIDEWTGQPTAVFPLWQLATATVRSSDDLAPNVPVLLTSAALQGKPVPAHVLAACLRRISRESGNRQFSAARMGLIKLILNRLSPEGTLTMNERLDPTAPDRSPGYACGRLLALLARCQDPGSFGGNAQILERYFGSASTSPRSVFPVLLRLNRHHIRKIRDDNPGFAFNLEQELEERLAPFRKEGDTDPNFPAVLSLTEQGRFAMGYYHQRADYRAASAEKKAQRENNNA